MSRLGAQTLTVLGAIGMVAMLSITAGRAAGQITIEEGDDPTIDTVPLCPTHVVPSNSPFADNYAPGSIGLPQLSSLPLGSASWAGNTPSWHKDRRPAVVIQMASNGYTQNTRGIADWWWISDNDSSTLDVDEAKNDYVRNPDDTVLYPDWVPGNPTVDTTPDQFDALIHRILYFKHNGFRRIILHLPAGSLGVREDGLIGPPGGGLQYMSYDGTTQSINQFNGMPAWKRNVFMDTNGPWHAFLNQHATQNPDTETDPTKMSIEVYIGGALASPEWGNIGTQATNVSPDLPPTTTYTHRLRACVGFTPQGNPVFLQYWTQPYTPSGSPNGGIPFAFDPREPSHMNLMSLVAMPWPCQAGIKSIWFDASSENNAAQPFRWGYLEFSHHPYVRANSIRIGGETIPTTDNNGNIPDDCAIANMKWFANSQVAMPRPSPNAPRAFRPLFKFTPRQNSEVHLVDNENGLTWEEWDEARERGFVVSMYAGKGEPQVELTKRWYSMGPIRVADFNGDGEVNLTDYTKAHAAINYAIAHPTDVPIKVFATGDIDDNGVIDNFDIIEFDLYWGSNPNDLRPYGEAKEL